MDRDLSDLADKLASGKVKGLNDISKPIIRKRTEVLQSLRPNKTFTEILEAPIHNGGNFYMALSELNDDKSQDEESSVRPQKLIRNYVSVTAPKSDVSSAQASRLAQPLYLPLRTPTKEPNNPTMKPVAAKEPRPTRGFMKKRKLNDGSNEPDAEQSKGSIPVRTLTPFHDTRSYNL